MLTHFGRQVDKRGHIPVCAPAQGHRGGVQPGRVPTCSLRKVYSRHVLASLGGGAGGAAVPCEEYALPMSSMADESNTKSYMATCAAVVESR